jgi:hypothetical protein
MTQSRADQLPRKRTIGFTPTANSVKRNVMKTTALILGGLLVAVHAYGGTCGTPAPTPIPVNSPPPKFNIVFFEDANKHKHEAFRAASFWEIQNKTKKLEFVVDLLFLGTDPTDNKTHLYVHELIPLTNEDYGWIEFPEDLGNANKLPAPFINGTYDAPGDFTRSVSTGHGLIGGGASSRAPTPGGFTSHSYSFCGHRDELSYDFK